VADVLDLLTRWLEANDIDVLTAMTGFRAEAHLEGERPIDAVVAPWDASYTLGGEVYRWVLANRADLRNRFVFIAEEVPPEFDAVVGGRCLAVPLSAVDEIVRVAGAIVRRVRTPPLGIPIIRDYSKPTLLLVEDDPALLDAMTHLLAEQGYAVTQTEGANQAIDVLSQSDFDAILSDWHIHDGSGADLYGWILDNKPALAARVVFLSEADQDDSHGRPMFRKGQDSQALVDVLKQISTLVRGG
jgi:CheY-like chemotaxis protein